MTSTKLSNIFYNLKLVKSQGHYLFNVSKPSTTLKLSLTLFLVLMFELFLFEPTSMSNNSFSISTVIPFQKALAMIERQIPVAQAPSVAPMPSFTEYVNPADGVSIQYPSNWEKIEYPSLPMSPAPYKVVVNFLAPPESGSDQWRQYFMIQMGNQSFVTNLVPQTKTTLGGNPGFSLIYANNEETFHIKTLEAWTTVGGNTYLLIFKAEATKFPAYLPVVQHMIDSFKIGESAGLSANVTTSSAFQKSMAPNILR